MSKFTTMLNLLSSASPLPHILLPFTMVISLASPRFTYRREFWILVICITVYACCATTWPTTPEMRYGLSNSWFFYLHVIEKLLNDPEVSYWRSSGKPQEALDMAPFSLEKFKWAIALFVNPRGIRWNFQGKHIRQHNPKINKFQFLITQISKAIMYLYALQIIPRYVSTYDLPATMSYGTIPTAAILVFLLGVTIYSSWGLQWAVVSSVGIISGLSQISDWPPLFGDIRDATTISSFWGSFWQGLLHETLLGYSRLLIRVLHIPRRTLAAYFIHILVGFGLSALFHVISASVIANGKISMHELIYDIFSFFLFQIIGIGLETIFLKLCFPTIQNVNPKTPGGAQPSMAAFGYVWVICWLTFSGSSLVRAYFRLGVFEFQGPFALPEFTISGVYDLHA